MSTWCYNGPGGDLDSMAEWAKTIPDSMKIIAPDYTPDEIARRRTGYWRAELTEPGVIAGWESWPDRCNVHDAQEGACDGPADWVIPLSCTNCDGYFTGPACESHAVGVIAGPLLCPRCLTARWLKRGEPIPMPAKPADAEVIPWRA